MKKILLLIFVIGFLTSCSVGYKGSFTQLNQTQVVLSGANFKFLGNFSGTVAEKKAKIQIRNSEGVISQAKSNLYSNIKAAGIKMDGSIALVNVTTDVVENFRLVIITVSADVIEFTK